MRRSPGDAQRTLVEIWQRFGMDVEEDHISVAEEETPSLPDGVSRPADTQWMRGVIEELEKVTFVLDNGLADEEEDGESV